METIRKQDSSVTIGTGFVPLNETHLNFKQVTNVIEIQSGTHLLQIKEFKDSIFGHILGRENWGHRLAILGQKAITYGELLAKSEALADSLRSIGVARRTLVGICLPHGLEYIAALLAIYRIGATSVLINPTATTDEKDYVRQNSGMSFLVTQDKAVVIRDANENAWNDLHIIGPLPNGECDLFNDDCMMIYTSGSTSRPKGVVLTEMGISNNVMAVSNYLALSPQDRTIVFTPPAYAYAVSQILSHLWAGGSIFPLSSGLMYPIEVLQAIRQYELTGIAANPTSFRILNTIQLANELTLDSIRYVMSGGQPLDSKLAIELSGRFRMSRILNMYGCTENSPRISFYWLPVEVHKREMPWPVGRPIPGTHLKIVDELSTETPIGTIGHILVEGNSLMRCYWKEPILTQERVGGGWLRTGDIGFIDLDGNLNLVGRSDNIISVGHEKVAPEEIEEVIRAIDGVVDVGVAPIADGLMGNVAVAIIVLGTDEKEISSQIRSECVKKLSSSKIPRKFVVVKSLPKTPYGKLDRRRLRELVQDLGISYETSNRRLPHEAI